MVVLLKLAFSTGFAATGFELPLVVAAKVLAIFFGSTLVSTAFATTFPLPNFFSTSAVGVSIAASGIASVITELFFLAASSLATCSLLSAIAPESSSSILKLVLRFDRLGSPLVSLRSCRPICPLFSTVTKLVRILERGRGDVPLLAMPMTSQQMSKNVKRVTNPLNHQEIDLCQLVDSLMCPYFQT